MAVERDFNEVLEDIFLREETHHKESYDEGYKSGIEAGNPEGYHLGYHRGAELGRELDSTMEATISKLRQQLDAVIKYITPLLPLANCHMVEFLTHHHWERLLPPSLTESLDKWNLNDAVEMFWKTAQGHNISDNSELDKWVKKAQAHCIIANNDYCLTVDQLQDRIKCWGGEISTEIKVREFMTSKKSYEVQTMSRLVAALYRACAATCCVEAGGGRGHLPVALSLGYGVTSLTVDCDQHTLRAAADRVHVIQKQWRAIARRIKDGNEEQITDSINKDLHRFAQAYVTSSTDLSSVVLDKFPELRDVDARLLLTGLHTCGNLGPDSLRLFTTQRSTVAIFNVPCCYHLLTESVDAGHYDVFQRDYGGGQSSGRGFPMSEHLRGYNLGRNARMLAAQSIDRVVSLRQLPSRSLLYRALLQILIKKHLPEVSLSDGKLKRIGNCENFKQYFQKADSILQLRLIDSLPDSYLTDVCEDMDRQWKEMVLFYLLRLCLAQVVETVILFDRLLFLFESGFQNVYLVKLFDPVLSPRCHSIVAIK